MAKKQDLPALPFYVGDWLKCPEVRALSPAARGLWIDMLCYMWESTERGYLTLNGNPVDLHTLSRMTGFAEDLLTVLLAEMENFAVYSKREDGAIFNRRMVRDQEIREIRAISGQKGGFATANRLANSVAKKRQIIEDETEDEIEYENESVNKKETEEKFEKFWNIYPSRNGKKLGKKQTFDLLKKIEDFDLLLAAVKNYADSEQAKNGFVKDPIRFLKVDYWKDWIEPEKVKSKTKSFEDYLKEKENDCQRL